MKRKMMGFVFLILFVYGMAFLKADITAQSATAGRTGGSKPAGEKTAGETYKNIQALTDLKDGPASEFISAMQFISGSLSVGCTYCHAGPFSSWDKDAKKTKLIARDMIKMTRAINESNFGGHVVVTCNTCHQGSPHPHATPTPWYKTPEQIAAYNKSVEAAGQHKPQPTESTSGLPDVDQIMANYRRAVGADGVKSIHILAANATVTTGRAEPYEAYIKMPDKILMGLTVQGNKIQITLNGDRGWVVTPQGKADLSPAQIVNSMDSAELYLPVKYAKSEAPRKVMGSERIGDRNYYIVESHPGKKSQRLYFDVQSGLLYKARAELGTPLGTMVEERTFEDYRDVNGVKLPFLITTHYMEDQFLFKVSEAQINIDIDPAKFESPAAKEHK